MTRTTRNILMTICAVDISLVFASGGMCIPILIYLVTTLATSGKVPEAADWMLVMPAIFTLSTCLAPFAMAGVVALEKVKITEPQP